MFRYEIAILALAVVAAALLVRERWADVALQ
jgi:hypothetical protein